MKKIAKIGGYTFAVSVICSVIAYGGIFGKAVAADFTPSTTVEQYQQVLGQAAKASGVAANSVLVWTPANNHEYQRF